MDALDGDADWQDLVKRDGFSEAVAKMAEGLR